MLQMLRAVGIIKIILYDSFVGLSRFYLLIEFVSGMPLVGRIWTGKTGQLKFIIIVYDINVNFLFSSSIKIDLIYV